MVFRIKISHNDKIHYHVVEQPKLYAETKQLLYKIIREELDVKKIYTRRSSVVCVD